jgi:hypothetical protein
MNHLARTATVLTLAALTAIPLPAMAKDGDVIRRGGCSDAASWKLKASPEDGRIEVEGEVDSNVNGQTWKWRLVHNGSVTAKGTATTSGPSGSFDVERTVVNLKGDDNLKFRAHNPSTDETCVGSLTF